MGLERLLQLGTTSTAMAHDPFSTSGLSITNSHRGDVNEEVMSDFHMHSTLFGCNIDEKGFIVLKEFPMTLPVPLLETHPDVDEKQLWMPYIHFQQRKHRKESLKTTKGLRSC